MACQELQVKNILFALFTAENFVKNYRFLTSKLTVIGSSNNRLIGNGKNRVRNTNSNSGIINSQTIPELF
jgi:hypothetical protein